MSASPREAPTSPGASKTETEASQGLKTFHVRWMLLASLVLVIVAMGGAWVGYMAAQGHRTAMAPPASVTSEERPGTT